MSKSSLLGMNRERAAMIIQERFGMYNAQLPKKLWEKPLGKVALGFCKNSLCALVSSLFSFQRALQLSPIRTSFYLVLDMGKIPHLSIFYFCRILLVETKRMTN